MRVSDFDYDLPPESIAQEALEPRDAARLLVHDRAGERTEHAHVRDLPRWLAPGDLVVVNDTRVLAARFFGRRATGGQVELLLIEPLPGPAGQATDRFRALIRPARRLQVGERLSLEGDALEARLVERPVGADGQPDAAWVVALGEPGSPGLSAAELAQRIEQHGRLPLPPYIERERDDPRTAIDRERYQTLFAARPGAVAAPTAGLHFTPALVERLAGADVELARVTLHVGEGTFRPVAVDVVEQHRMHRELYEVPPETAAAIARCRERGGRVLAVGTTTVRALESAARASEEARYRETRSVPSAAGGTQLFLTPGAEFRVVDALLTNFHLPKSTLLMMVAAFVDARVGRERVLALYREALQREYRFFSYGDAMLLL